MAVDEHHRATASKRRRNIVAAFGRELDLTSPESGASRFASVLDDHLSAGTKALLIGHVPPEGLEERVDEVATD